MNSLLVNTDHQYATVHTWPGWTPANSAMAGRPGRFCIIGKNRYGFVVKLWDAGGALLPTVIWPFEYLEHEKAMLLGRL